MITFKGEYNDSFPQGGPDLSIFERAVQDPCSEECDCEDEEDSVARDIRPDTRPDTGARRMPGPRSRAGSTSLIRHLTGDGSDPGSRRASWNGIPAHLYGLEKYVASALDALSAGGTPADHDSHCARYLHCSQRPNLSSPSSLYSSRTSLPSSDPSQSSESSGLRGQFAKHGRKKSFIEISLSSSFSQ